jgi:hypothetical protein
MRILRFFQNAPLKCEEAQVRIEVEIRRIEPRRWFWAGLGSGPFSTGWTGAGHGFEAEA